MSHDLRAPLNRIRSFGDALVEGFADGLPAEGKDLVKRIQASGEDVDRLVTAMQSLATIARGEVDRSDVDLSAMARGILDSFRRAEPGRHVQIVVQPDLRAPADHALLRLALENLFANAWMFTSRRDEARIEFGCDLGSGAPCYFVRDNGAGFDAAMAGKLFQPFRRLHAQDEFPGTGIGLAIVQRIVRRHGGWVWAQGAVGEGATFHFTL
jgi:signal transduction histidine kinase